MSLPQRPTTSSEASPQDTLAQESASSTGDQTADGSVSEASTIHLDIYSDNSQDRAPAHYHYPDQERTPPPEFIKATETTAAAQLAAEDAQGTKQSQASTTSTTKPKPKTPPKAGDF